MITIKYLIGAIYVLVLIVVLLIISLILKIVSYDTQRKG